MVRFLESVKEEATSDRRLWSSLKAKCAAQENRLAGGHFYLLDFSIFFGAIFFCCVFCAWVLSNLERRVM